MSRYLAIDLGAESGRVIVGTLRAGKLSMREVHRFPNEPIRTHRTLHWDVAQIFSQIEIGLRKAARHGPIASVACDSWGVDYVLQNAENQLLSLPYTYRDKRTFTAFAHAMKKVSRRKIFTATGIGSLPINTLYQLFDDVLNRPTVLNDAHRMLMIADYFTWKLSGQARSEYTIASTSQCWNTRTRTWAWPLLKEFAIPRHIFPTTVTAGTRIGPLLKDIAHNSGLAKTQVIATCAHDTAAAVVAIPAQAKNWAYLSSGTWSLLGVEIAKPIVNDRVLAANFTNEAGFGGKTRLLKCLVGLWILQECRREWPGKKEDYAHIVRDAQRSPALRSLIRPDNLCFVKPGNMTRKVQSYCRATRQAIPITHGEIARCIFESLALLYRVELDGLETITGRKISTLHVVGGGSRNALLNQLTADATGRVVIAGPVEATAAGNILVQAIAMKELAGLAALRKVVHNSFATRIFKPRAHRMSCDWENALKLFQGLHANALAQRSTLRQRRSSAK